ncbi:MAG: hypothetical protein ABH879_00200 [archaeon]
MEGYRNSDEVYASFTHFMSHAALKLMWGARSQEQERIQHGKQQLMDTMETYFDGATYQQSASFGPDKARELRELAQRLLDNATEEQVDELLKEVSGVMENYRLETSSGESICDAVRRLSH